jgi:hypothetical protein
MTDAVTTPAAPAAAPVSSATAGLLGDNAPAAAAAPVTPPVDAAKFGEASKADDQPAGKIKMPGKDATPEDWAAFYKSIGAPDSADAYKLPLPEGDSGEFAKTAAEWFKDAGLFPQQAEKLATKWNEFQTQFNAEQTAAAEAAETARIHALDTKNKAEAESLKTEWGKSHDANTELAKRAVRQFLPGNQADDILNALEDKLGYAGLMKFMHNIGARLGEDSAAGLGDAAQGGGRDMSFDAVANRFYGNK